MSGTIVEQYVIQSICACVRVGLKIHKTDGDHKRNIELLHEGQERAKANAIKTSEILKPLIKQNKLNKYFGIMPKDYHFFPRGTSGYGKFPEEITEDNADDFVGKKCIYSFPLKEIKYSSWILLYFNMLPSKDIRNIIVNTVKSKIRKDQVIALAIEYLKDNNLSSQYFQEPLSIEEFDTYFDVYFKAKGKHEKPGKCLLRVDRSGSIQNMTIK